MKKRVLFLSIMLYITNGIAQEAQKDESYNKHMVKISDDIAFEKLNNIPSFIKVKGKVMNGVTWNDTYGEHFVVTTETDIYINPDYSHEENEGADAELFAYHYIKQEGSIKRVWRVYDFIKDCPVEIEASFVKNTLHITDLDNDGIAEIWLMYRKVCHGDVSPLEMKIIMYEGTKKYAMRGYNKVKVGEDTYIGGDYKFDANFTNGPVVFRTFSKKMWSDNVIHTWGK